MTNPILSTTRSISIGVRDVNEAPTTVSLEAQTVPENMTGAAIGLLSSEDPDQGDTLSYQIFKASPSGGLLLVEGWPVIDSRFTVDGGNLALAPGSSLDYETTPRVGMSSGRPIRADYSRIKSSISRSWIKMTKSLASILSLTASSSSMGTTTRSWRIQTWGPSRLHRRAASCLSFSRAPDIRGILPP